MSKCINCLICDTGILVDPEDDEEGFEVPSFTICFKAQGIADLCVRDKNICFECAERLYPKFKELVLEVSPIGKSSWELYKENACLKNEIFLLQQKLEGGN